jgi:transcriptional regulator with XRE-family HTH domain
VSQYSLGLRLRAERERRRITLESIAANTKISVGLLRGLERDDVSRWPGGIFRRAFVRSYAEAIGLDGDEIVAEFLERFPDADLGSTSGNAAAAAAPNGGAITAPKGHEPNLRLTLDATWSPFVGGQVLTRVRERAAAAAVDVGLMLALAVIMFMIVGEFWAPLGITMLCYYVVSIMSLGNTPGVCLLAPRPTSEEQTLDFRGMPDHPRAFGDER